MNKRQRYLKQAVIPALAKPGDPLVSATGQIIRPKKKRVDVKASQPELTGKDFKASRKRTLQELPAVPQVMNGCAVVFMYTMLGLSDREIAQSAKIKTEDVQAVREHPAYSECFDAILKEFISANSALLAARVASYAVDAVEKIADISSNGKEENALRASVHLHDSATGGKSGVYGGNNGGSAHDLRIIINNGKDQAVDIHVDGSQFRNGARNGEEIGRGEID